MARQTLGNLLINVEANTTQLVQGFNRAENVVNKTTKSMGTAIKALAAAYVSLEAVDLAKSYARQVDELTNVNNRLKLVTKTSEEFASVQKELFNQAQNTRSMYAGTIDLYGRITRSTQNLTLSQKELLSITNSINKAMIIGGGSTESQQAALIQLGQAFSSNFKAVGQELGSIREQAPRLYEVMIKGTIETNKQFKALVDNGAEASGVFKKWAEDGKLSSEIVINALRSQGVVLDSEFSQMSMTIEQSMVTARNSLQKLIYDFDQTSGISATVSKSINDISKSMDSLDTETIVKIAEELALISGSIIAANTSLKAYVTLSAIASAANVKYAGTMNMVNASIIATTISTKALSAAMRLVPFVAVASGVYMFADALLNAKDNYKALDDAIAENSKGWTGLGVLEDLKFETATKNIASAYENLQAKQKAMDATRGTQVEAYYKKLYDDAKESYDKQEKEYIEYSNRLVSINKETEDEISSKKTETAISDELQRILDKSVLIKRKYAELRLELENSGKATAENIKILTDAENKEIEALSKKSNELIKKRNEEKLSQYLNYYEKIGEYSKLWQLEEQRIREENYLLKQDEINKLIELERAAFEAKANASGIEAAQTDIRYEERKLQLQAASYEKEVALAELQYANNILNVENLAKTREEKDYLLALEYELYNATLERLRAEDEIANIEKIAEDKESMLDYQLSLIDAADSWGNSLGGVAGQIGNIIGAYNKMSKIALNSQKQQLKLDTNLAKTKEKYGAKSIEYVEAENKHIMDTSALKQEKQNAEIAGYANLAGAMASAYEQGSAGAIAFTTLQATLGIASSWTAIANAWALPYPSNIPAVAMVASAVMPIIAQLTSMGGSGGGGGGSSVSYSQAEIDKFNIEAEYTPMVERLDRQIELLEAIERNGSAGAIKVNLAATTFEKDYKLLVNEFLPKLHSVIYSHWGVGGGDNRASNEKQFEDMLGFNLGDMSGGNFFIDKNSLKQDLNLMRLIETINANWDFFHNSGFGVLLDKDWTQAGDPMSMTVARIGQITNDMQELLHGYTMSLLESMQDLKDAKEEYISIYEELTDSRVFTDKKLADAFKSFNSLLSLGESYADYIYKEINNLQNLEKFLTNDKIEILLSQDPTNLKAQLDLLDELKRETGLTFENGARDAIDFLESIKLVSEALVTSRNNIKSFIDSFKSDDLLAEDLSISFGEDLAKNWDELKAKLVKMSSDEFGLTDDELEFLETNKAYIERLQELEEEGRVQALESQKKLNEELKTEAEKTLSEIKNNISKITSTLNTLGNTIDRLRGNADATNTYTLNKFYESMAKTQELLKGKDYEAISKSIQETVGYSSALSDSKNFTLTRDMQYAQLVAAKQFEDMDITLNEELDYLKMIEENTAKTVDALTATLAALGDQISNSIDNNSNKFDEYAKELEKATGTSPTSSTSKLVQDMYSKYDLHKYQTDSSGYDYWEQELATGKISVVDLEKTIQQAAREKGMLSFDVGTPNVPRDMVAKIHQGEIITPKTYSEGIRNGDLMMGNVSSIESALDGISNSVNALVGIASSQLMQLRDIRDISNGSLVSLQNMEAMI